MNDQDGDGRRRARPQYGEYATPEEQRAAIKQPAEWQLEDEPTDAAPQPPVPGAYQPGTGRAPGSRDHDFRNPYAADQRSAPRPPRARSGVGDRFATFLLLAYGLYNVIDMIANAAQGGALMEQSARLLDPSESQMFAELPNWVWGVGAAVYAVVWLISLVASLRALRAGRIAFWIPLLAGAVAGLLLLALVFVGLGGNPTVFNNVPTPGSTGTPT